jgi:hypothetical protein
MTETKSARYKTPFLVLAVLFLIWGILGVIDQRNIPYSGYITDGNNTVTRIDPGSPAERAGLQVGDYIRSIGGIPVENARALAARPRPEIGETWTLVVQQGATTAAAGAEAPGTRNVDITFTGPRAKQTFLGYAASLIGLCFIVFGLWPYMRVATRSATLLALVGLCLGVAFFAGPYLPSYVLRSIAFAVLTVLIIASLAFLLHYMMEFPKPKAMLAKNYTLQAVYVPAGIIALFALFIFIFQPTATSTLNIIARSLFGLLLVAYFGLAAFAMIHSYVKATGRERSAYGLNTMLIGVLVGLLPITIAALVGVIAPRVVLPGADFYFLTLVLIPIALALATMKKEAIPRAAHAKPPLM